MSYIYTDWIVLWLLKSSKDLRQKAKGNKAGLTATLVTGTALNHLHAVGLGVRLLTPKSNWELGTTETIMLENEHEKKRKFQV